MEQGPELLEMPKGASAETVVSFEFEGSNALQAIQALEEEGATTITLSYEGGKLSGEVVDYELDPSFEAMPLKLKGKVQLNA